MPTYRIQTSLQDDSGLPRHQYVNSLHWWKGSPAISTDFDGIITAVGNFYKAIKSYLSMTVAVGGHTVKIYLVGAPLESPPVHEGTFTLTPWTADTTSLPNEIACCLSFHADPQPGVARQSWRGRIYVGPLSALTNQPIDAIAQPSVAFRGALASAGMDLGLALNDTGEWVIYSKTQNMAYPVANVSVDNAWDIQRSRGSDPSTKTLLAVAGGGGAGHATP